MTQSAHLGTKRSSLINDCWHLQETDKTASKVGTKGFNSRFNHRCKSGILPQYMLLCSTSSEYYIVIIQWLLVSHRFTLLAQFIFKFALFLVAIVDFFFIPLCRYIAEGLDNNNVSILLSSCAQIQCYKVQNIKSLWASNDNLSLMSLIWKADVDVNKRKSCLGNI